LSPIELDHFFVAASGPEQGSLLLEEAGFSLGRFNAHPGQGTGSRGVFFENAYLELIWLVSAEEANAPLIRRTRLAERTQPGSRACPFGIGLRGTGPIEAGLSFPTWEYTPPYLPEGLSFRMGVNSELSEEPLVFLLPWLSGPAWSAPDHPNQARSVTRLSVILGRDTGQSEVLSALSEAGVASFRPGSAPMMVVELDEGRAGQALDLRPELPLRIAW
jgi:hypothetical protein